MHNYFCFFAPNTNCALVVALSERKQVPFNMAIGNGELMHECFPKHLLAHGNSKNEIRY